MLSCFFFSVHAVRKWIVLLACWKYASYSSGGWRKTKYQFVAKRNQHMLEKFQWLNHWIRVCSVSTMRMRCVWNMHKVTDMSTRVHPPSTRQSEQVDLDQRLTSTSHIHCVLLLGRVYLIDSAAARTALKAGILLVYALARFKTYYRIFSISITYIEYRHIYVLTIWRSSEASIVFFTKCKSYAPSDQTVHSVLMNRNSSIQHTHNLQMTMILASQLTEWSALSRDAVLGMVDEGGEIVRFRPPPLPSSCMALLISISFAPLHSRSLPSLPQLGVCEWYCLVGHPNTTSTAKMLIIVSAPLRRLREKQLTLRNCEDRNALHEQNGGRTLVHMRGHVDWPGCFWAQKSRVR